MLEPLDIRTLLLVVCIVSSLNAIGMLSFARRFPRFPGIGWIATADLLLAVGILLVAARDHAPIWLTSVVGNSLTLGGLLLNAEGLRRYAGGDWPWWSRPYLPFFLFLLPAMCWFTFADPDVRSRVLLFSSWAALTLATIALALRRSPSGRRLRLIQVVFAALALWMAWRWLHSLNEAPMQSFMNAGLVHALTQVALIVFVMAKGYGIFSDTVGQALEEVAAQARTDPLTGLMNRRALSDFAFQAIARARRKSLPLSLVLIDIDHFKKINDQHGHAAGDAVILGVANALLARIRATDACARLGGEEFLVVLPDTSKAQAFELAEALRQLVAAVDFGGIGPCTASFGVSTSGDQLDFDDLLREADRAMYAAKAAGRNCVVQA